jgi:hypothetical protein
VARRPAAPSRRGSGEHRGDLLPADGAGEAQRLLGEDQVEPPGGGVGVQRLQVALDGGGVVAHHRTGERRAQAETAGVARRALEEGGERLAGHGGVDARALQQRRGPGHQGERGVAGQHRAGVVQRASPGRHGEGDPAEIGDEPLEDRPQPVLGLDGDIGALEHPRAGVRGQRSERMEAADRARGLPGRRQHRGGMGAAAVDQRPTAERGAAGGDGCRHPGDGTVGDGEEDELRPPDRLDRRRRGGGADPGGQGRSVRRGAAGHRRDPVARVVGGDGEHRATAAGPHHGDRRPWRGRRG